MKNKNQNAILIGMHLHIVELAGIIAAAKQHDVEIFVAQKEEKKVNENPFGTVIPIVIQALPIVDLPKLPKLKPTGGPIGAIEKKRKY